ncbi:MAG: glucose PTS transporter subunit IIA [Clostridiales bacterium]|nr:glucose PTS transporter subunit IIA [Clostridiales bacterium]
MAKKFQLTAPVTGKCVDLAQVPDETFAGKVLGDGVAFIFDGNEVCSPCDGEITLTADTNHAVGIHADSGLDILLHVGIDTVALNGKGLEMLVKQGQKIKPGTPLIRIDRAFMKSQNINLITPMLMTNGDDYSYQLSGIGSDVKAGVSPVIEYEGEAQTETVAATAPATESGSGATGLKYQTLCENVIKYVGGKENVISVTHCVTRLRFKLTDESKANTEAMKATKGVMKVIQTGGQYQVVIGPQVDEVYKDLVQIGGFSATESANAQQVVAEDGEKQGIVSRFLVLMTGIFQPLLSMLMAGGMIKALLVLLTTVCGVISTDSGTYQILYAMGDALFYFFPVAIGWSAARKFGLKDVYGIVLGGTLVYPTLVALTSEEALYTVFAGTVFESEVYTTFLGIPVIFPSVGYTSSVIPIILIVWVASLLFKFFNKNLPAMLRSFFTPFLTLLITAPIGFLVVGPIAMILQGLLTSFMSFIVGLNAGIAGLVIGTFWSLLVMCGLHMPVIIMCNLNIATYGYDIIHPLFFTGAIASVGAVLGVIIRTKDAEERSVCIPAMISSFFGINEPTLYAVLFPRKMLMYTTFLSAGIGSMIAGFCGSKLYSFGASGILGLPCYINPEGIDFGFIGLLIAMVASFVLALISGLVFGGKKDATGLNIDMSL